jgi:hypothetical protein
VCGKSPFANKEFKRQLHLCAMSAIKHDAELNQYYQRKVAKGKNKKEPKYLYTTSGSSSYLA